MQQMLSKDSTAAGSAGEVISVIYIHIHVYENAGRQGHFVKNRFALGSSRKLNDQFMA